MIRLALPADKPLVEKLERRVPCLGAELYADWLLLSQNPATPVCIYAVGSSAMLAYSGRGALLCGEVEDGPELEAFLHMRGVRRLVSSGWSSDGWRKTALAAMAQSGQALPAPLCGPLLAPAPHEIMDVLQSETCFDTDFCDAYYANLCARLNRRLAFFVGVRRQGKMVCTAGIYANTPTQAYIAAVHTRPGFRGRGYAQMLVAWLCANGQGKTKTLLCKQGLAPFYTRLGFALREESMLELEWLGKT